MEKTYSHSQRNNNFNQCSSYSDNKRGRRKSRQGILELLTSYMLRRAMWSVLSDCESGKNSLSYNENQIGATKGVNEKKNIHTEELRPKQTTATSAEFLGKIFTEFVEKHRKKETWTLAF